MILRRKVTLYLLILLAAASLIWFYKYELLLKALPVALNISNPIEPNKYINWSKIADGTFCTLQQESSRYGH